MTTDEFSNFFSSSSFFIYYVFFFVFFLTMPNFHSFVSTVLNILAFLSFFNSLIYFAFPGSVNMIFLHKSSLKTFFVFFLNFCLLKISISKIYKFLDFGIDQIFQAFWSIVIMKIKVICLYLINSYSKVSLTYNYSNLSLNLIRFHCNKFFSFNFEKSISQLENGVSR